MRGAGRAARYAACGVLLTMTTADPLDAQGSAPPGSTGAVTRGVSLSAAQGAELRRLLDSTRTASGVPALAVAIVTTDGVPFVEAVGMRKLGDPTPVTRDDRFHIGSDTKAMTAGLIGLMVDEGKLAWDATLPELFPEHAGRMHEAYRRVTLRDLLTHRSGLTPNAPGTFGKATAQEQRAAFVPWVLERAPVSPHGTYAYANSNYILAGAIAERLGGAPAEELIVKRVLRPLGITTVGFGPAGSSDSTSQPWGHSANLLGKMSPRFADNPPLYGPAGRAHLSMRDWGLWARTVLRAASGASSPWTAETARTMFTPSGGADAGAMGWGVVRRPWAGTDDRVLVHDGSNTMNYASAVLVPGLGFGVLVATNQGNLVASAAVAGLVNRAIDVVTGRKR